jgi:hypothetical protein
LQAECSWKRYFIHAYRASRSTSFAGLPLVVCGVLKIVYDLSLLFSFRHIKPPEEKKAPR